MAEVDSRLVAASKDKAGWLERHPGTKCKKSALYSAMCELINFMVSTDIAQRSACDR